MLICYLSPLRRDLYMSIIENYEYTNYIYIYIYIYIYTKDIPNTL